MIVVETNTTEAAESSDERTLDRLFEAIDGTSFREGYKTEIVEGAIFMSPKCDVHWHITRRIVRALEDRFGMDVNVLSGVRIDFPGDLNGLAPDVAMLRDDAQKNSKGRWSHQDVRFVSDVLPKGDGAARDYESKKVTYAKAGVPAYLIVDPDGGTCLLHTCPEKGDYANEAKFDFGDEIDLTHTPAGLTLATDDFPRD